MDDAFYDAKNKLIVITAEEKSMEADFASRGIDSEILIMASYLIHALRIEDSDAVVADFREHWAEQGLNAELAIEVARNEGDAVVTFFGLRRVGMPWLGESPFGVRPEKLLHFRRAKPGIKNDPQ